MMAMLCLLQGVANPLPDFFRESWKKGARQIEEKQYDLVVSTVKPRVAVDIDDISGKTRYELTLNAGALYGYIDSWYLQLRPKKTVWSVFSLDRNVNLLQPTNDPYQDSLSQEDAINVLSPQCEQFVPGTAFPRCLAPPFLQKRVVKVEKFYVSFHVVEYEFAKDNPDELVSLKVKVVLSNEYTPGRT
jgi:hypothetical protein